MKKTLIGYNVKEEFAQYALLLNVDAFTFNKSATNLLAMQKSAKIWFTFKSHKYNFFNDLKLIDIWFEPVYDNDNTLKIGEHVITYYNDEFRNYIKIAGVEYTKNELIILKDMMLRNQIKSLNCGYSLEFVVTLDLVKKILNGFNNE